jgi:para-nitrobenzyl esterase
MNAGALAVFGSARRLIICAVAAYAAVAGCLATSAFASGVIATDKGPVAGVETPTMTEYLGIPYAASPTGDLRWRPPQPHERWHGPLDASHFGNHCPQPASSFGRASNSEDCLYLNVFTPRKRAGHGHPKHLPVMVWLHGGGFVAGESDDYDPARLVEQGVVVVTLNYRLGLLGFLAHPALSSESGDHASGDYGLMDQQAALRWVQRNIAHFGGDPDSVTIFGESAGGLSVHLQLASPLAAGLFERAIAQSGAYALTQPSLSQAEAQGSALAQSVGCADQTAACLRAVPVEAMLANETATSETLVPNVDGSVLPQSVKAALESGQFNRIPVIEGSNHDEFSIFTALNIEFVFGVLPPAFYSVVVAALVQTVGLNASRAAVLAEYPLSAYPSVALAVTAIGTDALFACPGRRAAQTLSQFVPTYAYEFNDRNAPQPFVRPASFPYGAYHGAELQYLFNLPNPAQAPPLDGDQQKLADTMVRYWTQFARSGGPNSPGTPAWPAYSAATDEYQSLVPPTPEVETGLAADHECAFWDSR